MSILNKNHGGFILAQMKKIIISSFSLISLLCCISLPGCGEGLKGLLESDAYLFSNLNHPPVLSPIGAKTVNEEELLEFTIKAADPDLDELKFSTSQLPVGADFDSYTCTFTWTPAYYQAGNYY